MIHWVVRRVAIMLTHRMQHIVTHLAEVYDAPYQHNDSTNN
jgi:hypothetical protein